MKSIQKMLVALAMMVSFAGFSNDSRVITSKDGDVTIVAKDRMVEVSVLNTAQTNYSLTIFSPAGEVLFEGELGNDNSLGRVFDFNSAMNGTYTFLFTSEDGSVNRYRVNTGNRF